MAHPAGAAASVGARIELDHISPGQVSQPDAVASVDIPPDRLARDVLARAGLVTGCPRRGGVVQILEAHCRRIYQSAMDGDLDAAVQLGERIKGKLSNPFTYRAVAMKGWSGLTTTDEVRRAVGILQDRGWVETVETAPDGKKGGRRSELVWVHPNLVDTGRSGTG